MLPKLEYYYNQKASVLDVLVHGSTEGMSSQIIEELYRASRRYGNSVVRFNLPFIEAGKQKSLDENRNVEREVLEELLVYCRAKSYRTIRLIGKSIGAVIAAEYIARLPLNDRKKFEIVVLGYDRGWINLKELPGKITVIQGSDDRFGDIDVVRRDVGEVLSKQVKFFGISGADHGFRDPVTREPKYIGNVVELVFGQPMTNKEEPGTRKEVGFEPVIQEFDYDCGWAAVSNLFLMLGKDEALKTDLRERLKTTVETGTKPAEVVRVLREEGVSFVERDGVRLSELEDFIRTGRGVALVVYQTWGTEAEKDSLESGHYSIVFDVDDKYVWLIDPQHVDEEHDQGWGAGVAQWDKVDFDRWWIDRDTDGKVYYHWMVGVDLGGQSR